MKVQGVFLKSSTLSWVVQNTDLAFQKQWKALKKHRKSCSLRIQTVIHAPPCLSFAGYRSFGLLKKLNIALR